MDVIGLSSNKLLTVNEFYNELMTYVNLLKVAANSDGFMRDGKAIRTFDEWFKMLKHELGG